MERDYNSLKYNFRLQEAEAFSLPPRLEELTVVHQCPMFLVSNAVLHTRLIFSVRLKTNANVFCRVERKGKKEEKAADVGRFASRMLSNHSRCKRRVFPICCVATLSSWEDAASCSKSMITVHTHRQWQTSPKTKCSKQRFWKQIECAKHLHVATCFYFFLKNHELNWESGPTGEEKRKRSITTLSWFYSSGELCRWLNLHHVKLMIPGFHGVAWL